MMTPLGIKMMLECYCSWEPWQNVPPQIWSSNAAKAEREQLVCIGLLDADLRVTEAGRKYVEALRSLPCQLGDE